MPPYIITDGSPEPPPELPAWGSLPLDIYMLEEWDTPYPEAPDEHPDQRRRRLVHQWLEMSAKGREPYDRRTTDYRPEYAPLHPTEEQIETILRPLRPDLMRCFSEYGGTNAGVWLRTCYDADKEEKHAALFKEFVTECEVVGPDGLVLDDHELFATDLAGMLELLPERVTSSAGAYHVTWREENLREIEEEEEEEEEEEREMEDDTQTAGDKKRREMLGPKKSEQKLVRNRYSIYHAACIVTHVFVEDEEALETGLVLHIYLDDCGNVVRQERVDATSVSNFDGLWFDGAWKESIIPGDGQVVGPAYLPGVFGVRRIDDGCVGFQAREEAEEVVRGHELKNSVDVKVWSAIDDRWIHHTGLLRHIARTREL